MDAVDAADAADAEQPQPVLLEVNYSSDYAQILTLRPSFVNDVFGLLFGGEAPATTWRALPVGQ